MGWFRTSFENNRKTALLIVFGPAIIAAITGIWIASMTSKGSDSGVLNEGEIKEILTASIDGSNVSTRLTSLTCLVCTNVKSVKNDQMRYDAACIGQFGAKIEGKTLTITVVSDAPYTPAKIDKPVGTPKSAQEKPEDIPILIESQPGKIKVLLEAEAMSEVGSRTNAASFRVISLSDDLTKKDEN